MVNKTTTTDPIDFDSDIEGDNGSDESEELGDELDASNSDSGEDQTRIPVLQIPSSVPLSGAALDFHSYDCFSNMGFGEPIEDNYDGNINIQRYSYDDEPDLRVGMRFANNWQIVYAVRQ